MPTILRISGYAFLFFSNEGNEPPHVHVFKGDGEAKVLIENPQLVLIISLSKQEARFILNSVIEHKETLLKEWEKIHG